MFRPEYEALTEPEQIRFGSAVKTLRPGACLGSRPVCIVRSLKANYQATLPPEPPPGGRIVEAKDRWTPPPAGW
jgi:hypothetical protein